MSKGLPRCNQRRRRRALLLNDYCPLFPTRFYEGLKKSFPFLLLLLLLSRRRPNFQGPQNGFPLLLPTIFFFVWDSPFTEGGNFGPEKLLNLYFLHVKKKALFFDLGW